MIITTSAEDTRISIGMANNEDSIHIEIGEGRDRIHHLYIHPDNGVHVHSRQSGLLSDGKREFNIHIIY